MSLLSSPVVPRVPHRHLLLIALLGLSTLLITCGPKPKVAIPSPVIDTTSRSTVTPYDASVDVAGSKMTVTWKKQGSGLISGYNIYISPNSLVGKFPDSLKPYNSSPYSGDTNPDDSVETYDADGLPDGVKYFVSVRVLYPDATLSAPSNEVVAVCGFRGEIELAVRFSGDDDGFSLTQGKAVRADDPANDLYLYRKDKVDYLASPSRLGGFLRETKMVLLSVMGRYIQLRESIVALSATPTEDKAAVKPGHWLLLRTADGTHALVQVLGVSRSGNERKLKLFIAHCPLKGELIF